MLVTDTPGRAAAGGPARACRSPRSRPNSTGSPGAMPAGGCSASWSPTGCRPTPFVHIDSDVFLWNRLPAHLTDAPVLTQNPEYHQRADYGIDEIDATLHEADGWLPVEWRLGRAARSRRAGRELRHRRRPGHRVSTPLRGDRARDRRIRGQPGRPCGACPSASGTIARSSSFCSPPASAFTPRAPIHRIAACAWRICFRPGPRRTTSITPRGSATRT